VANERRSSNYGTICNFSGVTGPILIKFAQYVEKIFQLNILNRNCDSRIRFEMSACWIKVISQILPKIGCHGNVPWGIWKWGLDRENSHKYLSYGRKIGKIGPVDAEIYLVDLKKEEITEVKYIARSASLSSGLKNRQTLSRHAKQAKQKLI